MLFYRPEVSRGRRGSSTNMPPSPTIAITPNPPQSLFNLTWIMKSFITILALFGLAYWLVQVAGAQYLATLTSGIVITMMLGYIVRKASLHQERRRCIQSLQRRNQDRVVATEAGLADSPPSFSTIVTSNEQFLKSFSEVPARDCSPPPTYEEAMRAIIAMTINETCNCVGNCIHKQSQCHVPNDNPGTSSNNDDPCSDSVASFNELISKPDTAVITIGRAVSSGSRSENKPVPVGEVLEEQVTDYDKEPSADSVQSMMTSTESKDNSVSPSVQPVHIQTCAKRVDAQTISIPKECQNLVINMNNTLSLSDSAFKSASSSSDCVIEINHEKDRNQKNEISSEIPTSSSVQNQIIDNKQVNNDTKKNCSSSREVNETIVDPANKDKPEVPDQKLGDNSENNLASTITQNNLS